MPSFFPGEDFTASFITRNLAKGIVFSDEILYNSCVNKKWSSL